MLGSVWLPEGTPHAKTFSNYSASGSGHSDTRFALHPIHTEVVGNIKGRDEIMAAMGSIGGLWLMLLSIKESKFWPYAGFAAVVFFLGLLSKENVITMLAVVP